MDMFEWNVLDKEVLVLLIYFIEVEVIKLFLNIYFVLCVVYFNELDIYVEF